MTDVAKIRAPRRKSQVTRERIADVARDLFNTQGYMAVSTNRIAEACAISPGNLYYHFRNREDILWFLCESVTGLARSLFVDHRTLPERGIALINRQLEAAANILVDFRFFFADQTAILRRDERVALAFRGLQADIIDAIAHELDKVIPPDAGSLRLPRPDPGALARSIWLVVTGWITFLLVQGRRIDRGTVGEVVETAIAPLNALLLRPAG